MRVSTKYVVYISSYFHVIALRRGGCWWWHMASSNSAAAVAAAAIVCLMQVWRGKWATAQHSLSRPKVQLNCVCMYVYGKRGEICLVLLSTRQDNEENDNSLDFCLHITKPYGRFSNSNRSVHYIFEPVGVKPSLEFGTKIAVLVDDSNQCSARNQRQCVHTQHKTETVPVTCQGTLFT